MDNFDIYQPIYYKTFMNDIYSQPTQILTTPSVALENGSGTAIMTMATLLHNIGMTDEDLIAFFEFQDYFEGTFPEDLLIQEQDPYDLINAALSEEAETEIRQPNMYVDIAHLKEMIDQIPRLSGALLEVTGEQIISSLVVADKLKSYRSNDGKTALEFLRENPVSSLKQIGAFFEQEAQAQKIEQQKKADEAYWSSFQDHTI